VLDSPDINVIKSARNIPGVTTTTANTLNVYDILNHEKLIMTMDAVKRVEEVYA
jgi:large subunit ribosomal protein L4